MSSEEQVKGFSLSGQEETYCNFADRNGYTVLKVFREEGQSAKTTKRDEFQKMMKFCKENKERVKYIIVYRIDIMSELKKENIIIKPNHLCEILRNPVYSGWMYKPEWNLEPVKGNFEAIISKKDIQCSTRYYSANSTIFKQIGSLTEPYIDMVPPSEFESLSTP